MDECWMNNGGNSLLHHLPVITPPGLMSLRYPPQTPDFPMSTLLHRTHPSLSGLDSPTSSEVQLKHRLPHFHAHLPSKGHHGPHVLYPSLLRTQQSPWPSGHIAKEAGFFCLVTRHACWAAEPCRRAHDPPITVSPQSPEKTPHMCCMDEPTSYQQWKAALG